MQNFWGKRKSIVVFSEVAYGFCVGHYISEFGSDNLGIISCFFICSLDTLRNVASADVKFSATLQEKDLKIAEMEQRYDSVKA